MQIRAKALSVVVAMVTTFAVLPTFGAAAAEPLEDGSYVVTVDASTYTVEVLDGTPVVQDAEGVEFTFAFDDETGRVLDAFDVTVSGTTYDVVVTEDGTVTVTQAGESDDGSEGEGEGEGEDETASEPEAEVEGEGEPDGEGDSDEDDGALGLDAEGEEDDQDDLKADDDGDEDGEDDGEHGELVSTVARCTPGGWIARAAGLPNKGYFVSAAARGDTVEFEADGEAMTADLATLAGAEEFCALATGLVEAAGATPRGDDTADDSSASASDTTDDGDDAPRGKGRGRAGDAPGRSGDAPGRAKQGR